MTGKRQLAAGDPVLPQDDDGVKLRMTLHFCHPAERKREQDLRSRPVDQARVDAVLKTLLWLPEILRYRRMTWVE